MTSWKSGPYPFLPRLGTISLLLWWNCLGDAPALQSPAPLKGQASGQLKQALVWKRTKGFGGMESNHLIILTPPTLPSG